MAFVYPEMAFATPYRFVRFAGPRRVVSEVVRGDLMGGDQTTVSTSDVVATGMTNVASRGIQLQKVFGESGGCTWDRPAASRLRGLPGRHPW